MVLKSHMNLLVTAPDFLEKVILASKTQKMGQKDPKIEVF